MLRSRRDPVGSPAFGFPPAFVGIAALGAAFVSAPALAGPVNPDISVIGDVRAGYSDASEEVSIGLEEVEVSLVGPLNPYASMTATLGITEDEGVDIEEAKLSLDRYLPGRLGLTAGKYLLDFGQLNAIHAHAYPFVDRPLMHQAFFGEEGAKDTGVRLDWVAPTEGVSLRAAVAAIRGDAVLGEVEPTEDPDPPRPDVAVTGRVEAFVEPSMSTSLALGASMMRGEIDAVRHAHAAWFGPDLKAKLDLGPAEALVVNAEAAFGRVDRVGEPGRIEPHGWFVSADWRANKRWNLGGFAEATSAKLDDAATTTRFGAFTGFALLEETTLFRLLGRVTDPDAGEKETEILIQAIFALGPHQAHRY